MELIVAFICLLVINNLLNNGRFTKLECKVDSLNDTIEKLNSRINELSEKLSKYE